jgi:hypothetical protein
MPNIPAREYPTNIFQQTTPDETQSLQNGPRFCTVYKGALTRSEIYERLYPDGITSALRIDGPSDSSAFLSFQSTGAVFIVTGEKNVEKGPASGKLCIHTHGQQQKHEHRTDIEYNCGDDSEEALNVIAYGDVVEQAYGSERHIKAQKIIITAEEELILVGKSEVKIQAGSNGGGAIQMYASSIEKVANNDKEVITGQKMVFGAGEQTSVQFDPRSSQNIISPGHINWKVLGDYKQWVGGVSQTIVAGSPVATPLIKDRTSTYATTATIGNMSINAVSGIFNAIASTSANIISAGTAKVEGTTSSSILSAGSVNVTGTTSTSIASTGNLDLNGGANTNITSGGTTNITSGAAVNITGVGNVNIKGALIFLN